MATPARYPSVWVHSSAKPDCFREAYFGEQDGAGDGFFVLDAVGFDERIERSLGGT